MQSAVKLLDKLSNYSQRKVCLLVFLRCHSSCLKLRSSYQKTGPHSGILFVQAATLGKWEFLSPSSKTYYTTLCMALDYLYLVYYIGTFRIPECRQNTTRPNILERRLVKKRRICLPLLPSRRLSILFFSTNGDRLTILHGQ